MRYHKCAYVFMECARYSCPIVIKHQFSRDLRKKYSDITFHINTFSGKRVVPCGKADRRDTANSRLSQFAYAPKTEPSRGGGLLTEATLPAAKLNWCTFGQ